METHELRLRLLLHQETNLPWKERKIFCWSAALLPACGLILQVGLWSRGVAFVKWLGDFAWRTWLAGIGLWTFLWQPEQNRSLQWVYWPGRTPNHLPVSVFLLPMPRSCRLWLSQKPQLKLCVPCQEGCVSSPFPALYYELKASAMSSAVAQLNDGIECISADSVRYHTSTLGLIPLRGFAFHTVQSTDFHLCMHILGLECLQMLRNPVCPGFSLPDGTLGWGM